MNNKRGRSGEDEDGHEHKSAKRQKRVSTSAGQWAAQNLDSLIEMNATWTERLAELTELSETLKHNKEELDSLKADAEKAKKDIEDGLLSQKQKQEKLDKLDTTSRDDAAEKVRQMTADVRQAERQVRQIERKIHEKLGALDLMQKQQEQQEQEQEQQQQQEQQEQQQQQQQQQQAWEEKKEQWKNNGWRVAKGVAGVGLGVGAVFLGLTVAHASGLLGPEEVATVATTPDMIHDMIATASDRIV
jgi:chromosome segregation ATPase